MVGANSIAAHVNSGRFSLSGSACLSTSLGDGSGVPSSEGHLIEKVGDGILRTPVKTSVRNLSGSVAKIEKKSSDGVLDRRPLCAQDAVAPTSAPSTLIAFANSEASCTSTSRNRMGSRAERL